MSTIANMYDGTGESFSNSVLLKTLSTSDLTVSAPYYMRAFTIYSGSAVKNLFDTYKAIYIQYTCIDQYGQTQTSKVIFKKSDYQYLKNLAKALPSGSFTYLKQSMYYGEGSKANTRYVDVRNYVAVQNYVSSEMTEAHSFMDTYCVRVYANDVNDAIIGSLVADQITIQDSAFSGQVYGLI